MLALVGLGTLMGTYEVMAFGTNAIVFVAMVWIGGRMHLNNPDWIGGLGG